MSQSDPTDNALAAIASILDQPPVIPRERERPAPEDAPASPPPLEEFATPPPLEVAPPIETPPLLEAQAPEAQALEAQALEAQALEAQALEAQALEAQALEAHGYSKVGPGPIAAIRFKWTVRASGGDYYVDETISESIPIVTGPMTQDAAIRFVDEHEAAARRRFELLKSEMAGRTAAANLVRKDSGEA